MKQGPLSWVRFEQVRDRNRSFDGIAAVTADAFNLTGIGEHEFSLPSQPDRPHYVPSRSRSLRGSGLTRELPARPEGHKGRPSHHPEGRVTLSSLSA